ncbi:hypothetical protein P775_08295 [Puniceibacterium antarcticum]|uniref:Uncharacterized protein n=1 Tax=Puniceibacterium antarcticum TaxID=1206336 RepID=A0A2G8RG56_9RHOB|nr:hypothetical protein [Puniceibacterium antarcticum]PIL20519.1 hypothetical protein P775_08295 [Puniceibacterium antarcticum]
MELLNWFFGHPGALWLSAMTLLCLALGVVFLRAVYLVERFGTRNGWPMFKEPRLKPHPETQDDFTTAAIAARYRMERMGK